MTSRTSSPRLPWYRKLAYGAAVLALTLGALEGAARLLGEPGIPGSPVPVSGEIYRHRLVNKWVLYPGDNGMNDCAEFEEKALHHKAPNRGGEVPINELGFRDTALARPRPPGQRRILVLGDSSVYGAWICRLDTLAEQLEAALNPPGRHDPLTRKVEVINSGVPGYSSYQSLEVLRRSVDLGLDGVIIYSMISDFAGPIRLDDDIWFGTWAPLLRRLGRLALYRRGHSLVSHLVERPRMARVEHNRHNRVNLLNYIQNLQEMLQMARDAGAWTVFVIPPLYGDVLPTGRVGATEGKMDYMGSDPGLKERLRELVQDALDRVEKRHVTAGFVNEDYRAAMALVALQNNAPLIDGPALIGAAAADDNREMWTEKSLMIDDVHPGPAGNALLARALVPVVRGLLPGARSGDP